MASDKSNKMELVVNEMNFLCLVPPVEFIEENKDNDDINDIISKIKCLELPSKCCVLDENGKDKYEEPVAFVRDGIFSNDWFMIRDGRDILYYILQDSEDLDDTEKLIKKWFNGDLIINLYKNSAFIKSSDREFHMVFYDHTLFTIISKITFNKFNYLKEYIASDRFPAKFGRFCLRVFQPGCDEIDVYNWFNTKIELENFISSKFDENGAFI